MSSKSGKQPHHYSDPTLLAELVCLHMIHFWAPPSLAGIAEAPNNPSSLDSEQAGGGAEGPLSPPTSPSRPQVAKGVEVVEGVEWDDGLKNEDSRHNAWTDGARKKSTSADVSIAAMSEYTFHLARLHPSKRFSHTTSNPSQQQQQHSPAPSPTRLKPPTSCQGPNISTVQNYFTQFVSTLLQTTATPPEFVYIALWILEMLRGQYKSVTLASGSEIRLFVTALMVADKVHDDNRYTSKVWADVSGIPIDQLNIMEVELLSALSWKVHINPDVYMIHQARVKTVLEGIQHRRRFQIQQKQPQKMLQSNTQQQKPQKVTLKAAPKSRVVTAISARAVGSIPAKAVGTLSVVASSVEDQIVSSGGAREKSTTSHIPVPAPPVSSQVKAAGDLRLKRNQASLNLPMVARSSSSSNLTNGSNSTSGFGTQIPSRPWTQSRSNDAAINQVSAANSSSSINFAHIPSYYPSAPNHQNHQQQQLHTHQHHYASAPLDPAATSMNDLAHAAAQAAMVTSSMAYQEASMMHWNRQHHHSMLSQDLRNGNSGSPVAGGSMMNKGGGSNVGGSVDALNPSGKSRLPRPAAAVGPARFKYACEPLSNLSEVADGSGGPSNWHQAHQQQYAHHQQQQQQQQQVTYHQQSQQQQYIYQQPQPIPIPQPHQHQYTYGGTPNSALHNINQFNGVPHRGQDGTIAPMGNATAANINPLATVADQIYMMMMG
ncbi:hypothetical protein HDV05_008146 [Chytridiales sp. JEL 0842]|nr:hypothetical protein HDV05_008146 [Chytridiales sp. JEL 0842]